MSVTLVKGTDVPGMGTGMERVTNVCAQCANRGMTRPASTPVVSRGVSLVKRGLVTPGTRRVRVPEFILSGRRTGDAERAVSLGPIGVGPMLERNDLRALSCTLRVMVVFGTGR